MTDVELQQFIGWANDTLGHCMGLQPRHVHVELSKPEYCRGVIGAYWAAWTARRGRASEG